MQSNLAYSVEPFDIPSVKEAHLPGVFGKFGQVVDSHIESLEEKKTPMAALSVDFYKFLRSEVDESAFTEIQQRYVKPETVFSESGKATDHIKYIDPIHWFRSKLIAATKIELDKSEPLEILDIGTGCGHFPMIARFFGHNVLGVDMPLKPSTPGESTHFYNEICDIYGVRKQDLKIEPFTPFEFDQKFDLVTAFMAAFNMMPNRQPYTIEAWQFFFKNLHEKVLNPGGRVMFTLAHGKITEEVWEFLTSKAEWYDDKSLYLMISDVEGVFA